MHHRHDHRRTDVARNVSRRSPVPHCIELFKTYGVELTPTDIELAGGRALLYCGIIGFSGENIRGSIAIAASGALLRASNPVPGGAPRDWAAELVNQLMGHVKSRLLGYSVEVYMSTPIVLRGERLALESRGARRPRFFSGTQSGDGQVWPCGWTWRPRPSSRWPPRRTPPCPDRRRQDPDVLASERDHVDDIRDENASAAVRARSPFWVAWSPCWPARPATSSSRNRCAIRSRSSASWPRTSAAS